MKDDRFTIETEGLKDILAQSGVEWDMAAGKWKKNWDGGRLSPGKG